MTRRAFSLFEMLIVLAIIGLLAALVAPRLAGVFTGGQVKQTKAQLQLLTGAIEKFHLDMLRYPSEAEGLAVLLEKPEDGAESGRGHTWSGARCPRTPGIAPSSTARIPSSTS